MEYRELTEKEIILLQMVFDYFNNNGAWPSSRKIQVKFRNDGDLWSVAEEIGRYIIVADDGNQEDSKTYLTVEGISLCNGSKQILDLFMRFLKICVERYLENPEDSRITATELKAKLKMVDREWLKFYQLFKNESNIWSGLSGNPDDPNFQITLSPRILRYDKLTTIDNYLEILWKQREKWEHSNYDSSYYTDLMIGQNGSIFNPTIKAGLPSLIRDQALKIVVTQDLEEIEKGFQTQSWKSICLLCGSVCEGLLWDVLQKANIQDPVGKKPNEKTDLFTLVKYAIENSIISRRVKSNLDAVRETRNLIHPGHAKNEGLVTRTMAEASYKLLETVFESVEYHLKLNSKDQIL